MSVTAQQIRQEVSRRRTFAIISHPDAGKTTLTEKLLLFGGCIEVAGAVRGRKTQRTAASDWMDLEKQRGISVSSTVLPFEYDGYLVNLLDTPGHHDFSEDTYRTLMAADCAVMVIDLAKGVEAQTEKLFKVCALRKMPVITFVNKVDRPGKPPLEILAEIEEKFGIDAVPLNWPLGSGLDFSGVIDVASGMASVYTTRDANRRIEFDEVPLEKLAGRPDLKPQVVQESVDEVQLLAEAGETFDLRRYRDGRLSPVFFGSALNNFGVEPFLRGFLDLCPPPPDRESGGGPIPAERPDFAAFVFKIQANLDPKHRDRIAFVRVCSGRFEREMEVLHARTGKKLRLKRALRIFGQERVTIEEAFAGDILGLINPGEFRLGDTICTGPPVEFAPLPQFSPENFAVLRCRETDRRKQFRRGLTQLVEEGAIQLFMEIRAARHEPILAAVGELQFDVVRYRLEGEYDTATDIRWLPFKLARWIDDDPALIDTLRLPYSAKVVKDQFGHQAVLFQSEWDCGYAERENPSVTFSAVRMAASQESQSAEVAW